MCHFSALRDVSGSAAQAGQVNAYLMKMGMLTEDSMLSLKAVLDWCIQQEGGAANKLALKTLRPLLISLAKPSPFCALLPPKVEMQRLLEEMKNNDIKQDPI